VGCTVSVHCGSNVRLCRRADRRWVSPTMTACRQHGVQTKTESTLQHCFPKAQNGIFHANGNHSSTPLSRILLLVRPYARLRLQGPGPGPWRRNRTSTRHIAEKGLEIFKADSCLGRPELSRYHRARTLRINFMAYQMLPAILTHREMLTGMAASKGREVFEIPKLFSAILIHLPILDLLLRAPLVSRSWNNFIANSPSLQSSLFFHPRQYNASRVQEINPLLQAAFPPWFHNRPVDYNYPTLIFTSLDWNRSDAKLDAYSRKEASW
jgi:hypothetical protein